MLLSIDPGLAKCGWALQAPSFETRKWQVSAMGTITTRKAKGGDKAWEDIPRRSRELSRALAELIQENSVKVVCTEALSFPRSSSAAAKLACSIGVISALCAVHSLPMVIVGPQAVKERVAGSRKASDAALEAALTEMYGGLPVTSVKAYRQHAIDALAVGVACLHHDVVIAAMGKR